MSTNETTNEHTIYSVRLGTVQAGALEVYVLDVAHEPARGLRVEAGRLVVLDAETAWTELVDAANSADCDVDRSTGRARELARADRDALQALARRVLRADRK